MPIEHHHSFCSGLPWSLLLLHGSVCLACLRLAVVAQDVLCVAFHCVLVHEAEWGHCLICPLPCFVLMMQKYESSNQPDVAGMM